MSGSVSMVDGHIDPDKKGITPQQAIKHFEDEVLMLENAPNLNGCEMTDEWREQLEICKMAKQAIEKQIPKKYIREKTDFFSFPVIKCPNCTGIIGKVEFLENCELVICPRGCPCCGQAIDNRSEVNAGK